MKHSTKNLKWINNGTSNKRVSSEHLNEFLDNGWVVGQLPTTLNHVWINKDGKNTTVDKSKLNEYLNAGWSKGKIASHKEKNCIRVNKDGVTKSIQKEELDSYLVDGWSRGVAYHYRWITNDIEERWTDIDLPEGWKEGRLYKNPDEIIQVYNNEEVLSIKKVELHKYEKLGYKQGKGKLVGLCEGSTKNTIWMNNGINNICAKPEEVDSYLALGYVKGNLFSKNTVVIHKESSTKRVKLSDLSSYLENGYELGSSYPNSMIGKRWVQKDNLFKAILAEEYNSYVSDGWLPGRPIKASVGKIWIYKEDLTTYIELDDLPKYIEDGWHSGRIPNSIITINNGNDEITISLDEYNLKYRNDESWKIGTKNHGCSSTVEIEFMKLLDENNIKYESHFYLNFNGKRYYYDFKIDNILIELNPFATHNSTWSPFNTPLEEDYHYLKTKAAVDSGYRCINVWDWDSVDILIKLLKRKDKIYARDCIVKEVDISTAKEFLNEYHFQGYARDSIRYGLFYKDELASIMTFDKPRYSKKYDYELIRYCSNSNVIGGAEKLFKHFISNYSGSIISYCDLSKFDGSIYSKLGFKELGITIGKHWYNYTLNKHITDNLLRQQGFDRLLGKEFGYFGKGTSNEQLMLEHDFVEIFDCGQKSFLYVDRK